MFMGNTTRHFSWSIVMGVGSVLLLGLAWLLPRPGDSVATSGEQRAARSEGSPSSNNEGNSRGSRRPGIAAAEPEAVVAAKVQQFARARLAVVQAMAKHFKVDVPPEVDRFFAAAERGTWEEAKAAFEALDKLRKSDDSPESLRVLWAAILETWGVAEIAHDWPAGQLLDYGESVLGSLRPGMVYVGGTDPGRFIPTLLNETSDGERHVVLTQNAFADASYLQYARFLYEDRLTVPSGEDSQRAFQDYLADAQKRVQHDQQLPDEPKQVLPGEDIRMSENRVQVSGQVAVMAINERLLQNFLKLNPDISFALEESFPFKSTVADAVPLGPIMELRGMDAQNNYSSERVTQTLDYWKSTASQLLADPTLDARSETRQAYSKMAAAQAGLLAEHQFNAEAEQAYRLAIEMSPGNAEPVYRLGKLLADMGRKDEARDLIDNLVPKGH
jgi:tetratricopeptide (TPR) repeat protein